MKVAVGMALVAVDVDVLPNQSHIIYKDAKESPAWFPSNRAFLNHMNGKTP